MLVRIRERNSGANAIALPAAIGRETEIVEAYEQLLAGISVALSGDEGSGKSLLAMTLSHRLIESGHPVIKVHGTESDIRLPLSAIVRGVAKWAAERDAGMPASVVVADIAQAETVLEQTRGRAKRPAFIVVDDVHLLDRSSLAWLEDAIVDGRITAIMAINSTLRTAQDANSRIIGLWQGGHVHRIDLPPLSKEQTLRFVDSIVGTGSLGRAIRIAIYRQSQGSPALIRELTAVFADDSWNTAPRWESFVLPSRILEIVLHRYRNLTPAQREALLTIGMLGSTSYQSARQLASAPIIASLLQRGFLEQHGTHGSRVFVTKLTTTALLQSEDPARVKQLFDRALSVTMKSYERGEPLIPAECSAIAEAWIESFPFDDPVGDYRPELVADVFTIAAHTSNRKGSTHSAFVFAQRALEISPSVGAAVEYSRAHFAMSNPLGAHEALDAIDAGYRSDMLQDRALEGWRRSLSARESLPGALRASTAAEPPVGDFVEISELFSDMSWEECAERAGAIAFDRKRSPLTRLRALTVLGYAAVFLGQGDVLSAIESHRIALQRLLQNSTPAYQSTYGSFAQSGTVACQFAHLAVARVCCGIDVGSIGNELDDMISDSLALEDYESLGILSTVAGVLALREGNIALAEVEFKRAGESPVSAGGAWWREWVASQHAVALAGLGRFDEAREVVEVAFGEDLPPSKWRRYLRLTANIAIDYSSGNAAAARTASLRAAEEFGENSPILRTNFLVIAVASGEPPASVVDALEADAERSDLEQVSAMAIWIRTLVRENRSLDATTLPASDPAVPNSFPFVASSVTRGTAKWGTSSQRGKYRSESGTVKNKLTSREQEIAALAAAGSSNREIANRLYLSVRTVESHLYQAKVKLGISSRHDLSEYLESAGGHKLVYG